jgi:hypothetical protein
MTKIMTLALVLAALPACKKKRTHVTTETFTPAGDAATAMAPADAAPAAWDGTTPLSIAEGFTTPESMVYDAESDIYLVSNINGEPLGADDNGFIAKVSPEGKITEGKWIDGAKDTVKLDAPKGMALAGGRQCAMSPPGPVPSAAAVTATSSLVLSALSEAVNRSTYAPATLKLAEVESAFAAPKVTVPGPLTLVQFTVSAPGGFGCPSSEAVPWSDAPLGNMTV